MIQNSSAPRRSISENLLRLGTMMVRERARQREKQKRRNRDGQPDHSSDNARGTKRKTENEGEHEVAEGQDSMAVSCLRVEELTRRDIHEEATTRGRYDVGSVEEEDNKNVNMAMDVPIEEDYEQKLAEASDYIDGQELEPEVVKKARALEMEWYWKMNVYEKRPEEECFEQTKKPPIKVKWFDRNKRDRQHINVRSRLVTKQINTSKEQGFFEATPRREGFRMLLSATVAGNKPKVFMINDVSRDYMHARTSSDIYVELCEEDRTEPRDENRCGKLVKSMYETRAAAHDWQSEVTGTMTELGFKQGKASPCVFRETTKRY